MNKLKQWFYEEENKTISYIAISGIALLLSFLHIRSKYFPIDIAWIAIILCGFPIVKGAVIGLIREFDIKADVLVSIALIASVLIGQIFAAGEVAFIMAIGALLEERTVRKAREGIEKLIALSPRTARVIREGTEEIIPADQVIVNDVLRVLAGETIAVDGIITSGQTSINQSVMTGESLPVDKGVGDEVASGTINQFGTFEMKATKVGEDSSLQRMIKLVEQADANKAPIVGLTDRWATWIVVIALSAAIITFLITGEIIRAVTILVVFCPCALVLATPTAIMAAIGNATKFGILIRTGDALERLSKIKHMAFDKTGTLTYGKPEVICVKSFASDIPEDVLLEVAASAEQHSEHPLGRAIVNYAKGKVKLSDPQDFVLIPGRGVCATIEKKPVIAGNKELLAEKGLEVSKEMSDSAQRYLDEGCTSIFVAIDNKAVGFIAMSDTLRSDAVNMVERLHSLGVNTLLLTGDNSNAANHMAQLVCIANVKSGLLPEDKMNTICMYQNLNEPVCMVGDGVNDAPALKTAYVGVAMGGIGSDIAVEAADVALVSDDILRIPYLMKLSQKTMKTIKLNVAFSMGLNFIAIILAITGILNPIFGALVHNAGSVAVILNSAVLLNSKDEKNREVA
ncbi:MAG: heavy metal translocating P-type ATPase [Pseudomonadota bacterium]